MLSVLIEVLFSFKSVMKCCAQRIGDVVLCLSACHSGSPLRSDGSRRSAAPLQAYMAAALILAGSILEVSSKH